MEFEPDEYYAAFVDMVKNLLDGNMEPSAYEDTLREMFGIHAYVAFTMDKIVTHCVRQVRRDFHVGAFHIGFLFQTV